MDNNEKRQRIFQQLEMHYRHIVDFETGQLRNHGGKPTNVDHPFNFLRVKLLYKLSARAKQPGISGESLAIESQPKPQTSSRFKLHFNKIKINKKLIRKLAYVFLPLLSLILLFAIYSMFFPDTIDFDVSNSSNCEASPLLLPGLFGRTDNATFDLTRSRAHVFGLDIYSARICAKPLLSPAGSTSYKEGEWLNLFGLKLGKSISIKTGALIQVNAASRLAAAPIPIEKPLLVPLSGTDQIFSYALSANGKTTPCTKNGDSLSCNLVPLGLSYSTSYSLALDRIFNNKVVGTLVTKNFQTITATAISQTSISSGSTVYAKPQSLSITTSKSLTKLDATSLSYTANGKSVTVPIKTTYKGDQITITWGSVLPRSTTFDFHLVNLMATDDSTLEQPYDLTFATSGGPEVTSSNIPSYGLNSGQTMDVSFSQPLDVNQSLASLVTLLVNGQAAPATVSLNGNQGLVITPGNSYPVCATVKVEVSGGVESNYDISGNSAWSYTTRSHCYSTYSIGTSVDGRPITAYQFGSNPNSNLVLFIAAMEGNEQNSANLLAQWIPNIDANPSKIPAGRTIIVIPQINPDGYAADTRLNAAGIDLNRNFPSSNWSEQVTEPLANTVVTNDGGPYPLSAPESQALATFYEAHKPLLTLTMHSHGGIVEANDAGDSITLGAEYARLADYRAIPTYQIGNFFDYTTTGAFEDWANDKLDLPVLEVELESATNDEYSRNLPALWAMAEIPN